MEHLQDTLKQQDSRYAQLVSGLKEERHIWHQMIRIEQLKKEKLRKKTELLRKTLQNQ